MSYLKLPKKYLKHLEEAKKYESRCLSGKRWGGEPLLIIVDSALDSVGLSYFNIVVPRVVKFKELFIDTGKITTLQDLAVLKPSDVKLRNLFNYERAWYVAIQLAKVFNEMAVKMNCLSNPMKAMKDWAIKADYRNWKNNIVGKIKGIGLITFQYLRMQLGVDTCMPDKIIKKYSKIYFGLETNDDYEFIEAFKDLCNKLGISQILLSWLIWLAESDKI
ncbi:MAG: hypothetical protein ACTSYR_00670 [Candidatus Odinarchaeia archaeon]